MARPRLIILVRHGESESNKDKLVNRTIPNNKVALTAKGRSQARSAGEKIRKLIHDDERAVIYTSPYQRARETAEGIISGLEDIPLRVFEDTRLREQDFGNFQADINEMRKIHTERAKYGHFFYRIPNGESAADVFNRVAGFNEMIFRQFSSERFPSVLILVSHGLLTRVFLMKWFRWTVERFESLQNVTHCGLYVMERQYDKKYLLHSRLVTWYDEPISKETEIYDTTIDYLLQNQLDNLLESKSTKKCKLKTQPHSFCFL